MTDHENSQPDPMQRDFLQHPDIRTLQGVDDRHVVPEAATRVDLMGESKRIDMESLPLNAVSVIKDENGSSVELFRGEDGKFILIQTDSEGGEPTTTPVEMLGSSATPNAFFDPNQTHLIQGTYLHLGKRIEFGPGEEPPEGYEGYPDPATLDPQILRENLSMGIVRRREDGSLVWSQLEEYPPIGPIRTVESVSKDGIDRTL